MIKKGKVSSIANGKIKVIFPDKDDNVTAELPVCSNVGSLQINDIVIMAFWGSSLADGAIIGTVI